MRNNFEVGRQMFKMIEQWQQSGLSQKLFYEKESIKFYTFYYWYKSYRLSEQDAESKSGSVEIHFPGDVRLFFHEPVSPEYLKTLIR